MAKSTKTEVKKRINIIFKMLTLGTSRGDIIQFASEQWNITDRQTDSYIKRANANFAKIADTQREEQFGLAMRRLNDLYFKTMKIDDYKAALATQKEINALLGLYAPSKVDIGNKDGKPFAVRHVPPLPDDILSAIDLHDSTDPE